MATAKKRIKELLDEIPEDEAARLELLLLALADKQREARWQELASAAFAAEFSDEEYQYPDDAGSLS